MKCESCERKGAVSKHGQRRAKNDKGGKDNEHKEKQYQDKASQESDSPRTIADSVSTIASAGIFGSGALAIAALTLQVTVHVIVKIFGSGRTVLEINWEGVFAGAKFGAVLGCIAGAFLLAGDVKIGSRDWTPATLLALGGTGASVGLAFLALVVVVIGALWVLSLVVS